MKYKKESKMAEKDFVDNGKGAHVSEFDIEKVSVGESSTDFGGKGSESKAKANTSAELAADRNENDVGPFGGPKYGVPKKNSHTLNKKTY